MARNTMDQAVSCGPLIQAATTHLYQHATHHCISLKWEIKVQKTLNMSGENESDERGGNVLVVLMINLLLLPVVIVYLVDSTVPDPIDPESFRLPALRYEGSLLPNTVLTSTQILHKGLVAGPESLLLIDGHIFTGTADGKVLDIFDNQVRELVDLNSFCFGIAGEQHCSRPLGLRADHSGFHIYVADSLQGLFKIDRETGETEQILSSSVKIDGETLKLPNDLAVAKDDSVFFTDTDYKWGSKDILTMIMENRPNGRLLRHDTKNNRTELLLSRLYGANGVLLSQDEDFLLICESSRHRILKYHLLGDKAGTVELFADLPGAPDNVRPSKAGGFWVAIAFARHPTRFSFFEMMTNRPWTRRLATKLFGSGTLRSIIHIPYGLIVELDARGNIVRSFHDPTGQLLPAVSQVEDQGSHLYIGSFAINGIAKLDLAKL